MKTKKLDIAMATFLWCILESILITVSKTGALQRLFVAVLGFVIVLLFVLRKVEDRRSQALGAISLFAILVVFCVFSLIPRSTLSVRISNYSPSNKVDQKGLFCFVLDKPRSSEGKLLKQYGELFKTVSLLNKDYYVFAVDFAAHRYLEAILESDEQRKTEDLDFSKSLPITSDFRPLYFNLYSCQVDPAEQTFQELKEYCFKHPGMRLLVVGHTDTTGSNAINMKEAMNRALAVKSILINKLIASESKILCLSCGEYYLAERSEDEQSVPANRRVVIYTIHDSPTYRSFQESDHSVNQLISNNPSYDLVPMACMPRGQGSSICFSMVAVPSL